MGKPKNEAGPGGVLHSPKDVSLIPSQAGAGSSRSPQEVSLNALAAIITGLASTIEDQSKTLLNMDRTLKELVNKVGAIEQTYKSVIAAQTRDSTFVASRSVSRAPSTATSTTSRVPRV